MQSEGLSTSEAKKQKKAKVYGLASALMELGEHFRQEWETQSKLLCRVFRVPIGAQGPQGIDEGSGAQRDSGFGSWCPQFFKLGWLC